MIDIRNLRISSHVAHRRYPGRVFRVECIMPTSVYLSYLDSGVRVKMYNVPLSELEPLEKTPERLAALRKATGLGGDTFKEAVADWHELETFAWIEFRAEIINED